MIIINGASRGIGKYLLQKYFELNFEVVGTYNKTKPSCLEHLYSSVDVQNMDDINNFVRENKDNLTKITLINCSGITYNSLAHKSNIELWEQVVNVNLIGSFRFILALLPIMRSENYGRIINMASIVAQKGVVGTSSYAASKSGLWGMSKSLAIENANKNITVNNINLGYTELGMINDVPIDFQKRLLEEIPVKRFGFGEEIFNTCEYLRNNSYITGTSIDLNGGLV